MMEAIENEDDDEMESLTDDYGVLTNVIYRSWSLTMDEAQSPFYDQDFEDLASETASRDAEPL